MLTIRAEIKKGEQKSNGTYNVKLRFTHQRKVKRLSTSLFVRPQDYEPEIRFMYKKGLFVSKVKSFPLKMMENILNAKCFPLKMMENFLVSKNYPSKSLGNIPNAKYYPSKSLGNIPNAKYYPLKSLGNIPNTNCYPSKSLGNISIYSRSQTLCEVCLGEFYSAAPQ